MCVSLLSSDKGKVYKVVVVRYIMKISCPKCRHSWNSESKLGFVICASCGKKINVKANRLIKIQVKNQHGEVYETTLTKKHLENLIKLKKLVEVKV